MRRACKKRRGGNNVYRIHSAQELTRKKELLKLPEEYGVELDLRDDLNGRIYICHNPFEPGEDFEEYCKVYHHGTMILNIKSERIEHKALEYMEKYQIKNYFFSGFFLSHD